MFSECCLATPAGRGVSYSWCDESPEQVWTKVEATKWQLLDKDLTEIDRITRDLAA